MFQLNRPGYTDDQSGIVYILSNAAMPVYLKIGRTSGNSSADVIKRMKELDTAGVPRQFVCEYAAWVKNYKWVEQDLHDTFTHARVHRFQGSREFFRIGVSSARKALKPYEIREVTPRGSPLRTSHESEQLSKGPIIAYILTNPAMPGYINVGFINGDSHNDVVRQMQQLDGTGLPSPFAFEYAALVNRSLFFNDMLLLRFRIKFGRNLVPKRDEFLVGVNPSRVKEFLEPYITLEVRDPQIALPMSTKP